MNLPYFNPKESIEVAIRIAREGYTKRRRKDLTISELYLPIGQALDLEKLDELLQPAGSGFILRTFYPSGNLLFNLKINLDQGKVGSLLSQVSKIPDKAIPYFLQGA